MSIPERTSSSAPRPSSRRLNIDQARSGAIDKVREAHDTLDELQRRHDRAADRVEVLARRRAALDLELADAERERDQTESRLEATRQALAAAERRLMALGERD